MDRNYAYRGCVGEANVALRKESVDRNLRPQSFTPREAVALRKESVDRNQAAYLGAGGAVLSLSARRAWIEIVDCLWDEMSCSGRSPQGERG